LPRLTVGHGYSRQNGIGNVKTTGRGTAVNNHIAWAKDLYIRGFQGFYEKQSSEVYATLYPNYPPLSLFIFYLVYPLQSIIYKIAWWLNLAIRVFPSNLIFFIQKRILLAAMFKLPAIAADLGIAWLILNSDS